ncbi:MAG: hypothetical protein FWD24_01055 [Treponema sp.]|nr:hypothetical protein [Treponema sp.]
MKFSALKNYTFYPVINDNLELPESERLSVEIIRPTAEDHETLVFVELTQQVQKDSKGKDLINSASRTKFNTSKILRRHIGEIKNLFVEDTDEGGKEKQITTGEELACASFSGMFKLVNEICVEVCSDKLSDSQKKILKQDSTLSGEDGTSGN